ncbi:hypothetical protein [Arthrobacter sp. efr-133-R2A-63]|uniref:hypothetical protein n=1 Tax=Arthrobacter sp. efr-133-R2A-63 TaxID=3040278 RepID=UPI00254C90DB|nr:hypothetical protein [Arthrobacter sp. efr-133-R2A-63]
MGDSTVVSLHLAYLGTLVVAFSMFLAGLVLFTALLVLAGALRLLALTARRFLSRTGAAPGVEGRRRCRSLPRVAKHGEADFEILDLSIKPELH